VSSSGWDSSSGDSAHQLLERARDQLDEWHRYTPPAASDNPRDSPASRSDAPGDSLAPTDGRPSLEARVGELRQRWTDQALDLAASVKEVDVALAALANHVFDLDTKRRAGVRIMAQPGQPSTLLGRLRRGPGSYPISATARRLRRYTGGLSPAFPLAAAAAAAAVVLGGSYSTLLWVAAGALAIIGLRDSR
jgi:hypothetical protein